MTNIQSKHVALLQNKQIVLTYVCVILIDIQAHRDAFIQNIRGQSSQKHLPIQENLRTKVQNCCANICFNQQCLKLGVIPKYAQIKVRYTSPASTTTQKKMQTTRIREEVKFLYKKKDKLKEMLYKTHLQAASEWGKTWDLVRDSIHNTVNLESEKNTDSQITKSHG